MIFGVMKTMSSLRCEVLSVVPMSLPITGSLSAPGTVSREPFSLPLMRPPSSTVPKIVFTMVGFSLMNSSS